MLLLKNGPHPWVILGEFIGESFGMSTICLRKECDFSIIQFDFRIIQNNLV